jgi:hypothetical protein
MDFFDNIFPIVAVVLIAAVLLYAIFGKNKKKEQ